MSEEAGLEGVSSGASETGREGGGRGGEGLGGLRGEGEGRGEGRLPDFSLVRVALRVQLILDLAPRLISCMTLGQSLDLSESRCPHL